MKNNISKITLISTLLVSNVATAKNFYTCVPKKEWVEKVIQEKEDKKWEFVKEIKITRRHDHKRKPNIEKIGRGDLLYGHYVKFVAESFDDGVIRESLTFKIMDEIMIKPYVISDDVLTAVYLYYQDEYFLTIPIPSTLKIYIRRF